MKQFLMLCAACALLIGCGNPKGRAASADASLEAASDASMGECVDAEKAMGEQKKRFSHQSSDYGSQPEIRSAAVRELETCKPAFESFDDENSKEDSDPEDIRVDKICKKAHREFIIAIEDCLSNASPGEYSKLRQAVIEDGRNCAFQLKIRARRAAIEAEN